jgi:hypothetical protein
MSGYRLRRPRLFANFVAARVFLAAATGAAEVAVVETVQHVFDGALVFGLLAVILVLPALWPMRILDVTPYALRFRVRRPAGLLGKGVQRLETVGWRDVREMFVAPHDGGTTVIVGYDGPYGLRAAVVELPVADPEPALAAVPPGVPVHRGSPVEILAWTRQPYVLDPWTVRRRLVVAALTMLAFGTVAAPIAVLGEHFWIFTGSAISVSLIGPSALCVAPEGLQVVARGRQRTVPWSAVRNARISATGELTVHMATARPLTCRVRREDLADVDAVLRAYAPPQALT